MRSILGLNHHSNALVVKAAAAGSSRVFTTKNDRGPELVPTGQSVVHRLRGRGPPSVRTTNFSVQLGGAVSLG
jgi:hypothetical protein